MHTHKSRAQTKLQIMRQARSAAKKAADLGRVARRSAELLRKAQGRAVFIPRYADVYDRHGNVVQARYLGHRAYYRGVQA